METVEVVIKMPKDKYDEVMDMKGILQNKPDLFRYSAAVANGILLPKGHGDLVDRKQIIEHGDSKGFCDWWDELKLAEPVIEAEKTEVKE